MPCGPSIGGYVTEPEVQQEDPVLTIDAIITSLDTTEAYVLIKARSVTDFRPLTILSELDSTVRALPKGRLSSVAQTGRQYTFRLRPTYIFKYTAPGQPPEYDLLHFEAFWIGNLRIVDTNEVLYMAINMQGYRIQQ
jgi:hypothetical protein